MKELKVSHCLKKLLSPHRIVEKLSADNFCGLSLLFQIEILCVIQKYIV